MDGEKEETEEPADPAGSAQESKGPITLQDVERGYRNGTVRLVTLPGIGTVCRIGEYQFSFGGKPAWKYTVEDFKKKFMEDEIVHMIFDVIEDMRYDPECGDEYEYYQSIML